MKTVSLSFATYNLLPASQRKIAVPGKEYHAMFNGEWHKVEFPNPRMVVAETKKLLNNFLAQNFYTL